MTDQIEARKQRHHSATTVKQTRDALNLARHLLDRGDIVRAARATQLAERQAKLAERLIDLKASLKRIAEVKRAAELHFAQRTADLIKRETSIAERERLLPGEPGAHAWINELLAAKKDRKRNGGW